MPQSLGVSWEYARLLLHLINFSAEENFKHFDKVHKAFRGKKEVMPVLLFHEVRIIELYELKGTLKIN